MSFAHSVRPWSWIVALTEIGDILSLTLREHNPRTLLYLHISVAPWSRHGYLLHRQREAFTQWNDWSTWGVERALWEVLPRTGLAAAEDVEVRALLLREVFF